MLSLYCKLRAWMVADDGATAVEYGIMVAAIAAVIIAVVIAVGAAVRNAFQDVNANLGTL
jgi:pilus assembly protein Flp/PilA